MSRSASEAKITDLYRQLNNEKNAHAATRNELQAEIQRVWRLVSVNLVVLMHELPSLNRLLLLSGEAVGLADPLRGAPIEDTMRTQFVSVGVNASTSATEAGVFTHDRHRYNLAEMEKRLGRVADDLGRLIAAPETKYHPPDRVCECGCGRLVFQNDEGRRRTYYSASCRKRAERDVTKRHETSTA